MVDTDTMMNEMGGAFMLSWLVVGEMDLGGALVLAAAWMAIGGAHILPVITWGHIMTGDLTDSDSWMDNGSRLVAQVIGAVLAVLLLTSGESSTMENPAVMWKFDMWPALGLIAGGALLWTVYDRCDAWVTAFVVMALGTMVGGNYDMAENMMGSGDVVNAASHWVMDGLMVGLGAMASVKIVEMT